MIIKIVIVLMVFLESYSSNAVKELTVDGVDVSFPIHHYIENKYSHFAKRYQTSMDQCYVKYSKSECDATERARIAMNLEQPKNQHNYTEIGFKKTRVPDDVWGDIQKFYEENKDKQIPEDWPRGNTYVNTWVNPSLMISFEDRVSYIWIYI